MIVFYLKKNTLRRIAFDPKRPEYSQVYFNDSADWTDFYGDLVEEYPPHMPEPLGKAMKMACFVDSNHAGNVVTRRSHTGIMIFLQNAPILPYSKRQNTVESATFGSELVALRVARDLIVSMRIKLRSFGIPIDGPCDVFCDNEAVFKNVSRPESTLTKKHNAINYHICREAVAALIMRVAKEDTLTNIADAFTKLLTYSRKRELVGMCQYDR